MAVSQGASTLAADRLRTEFCPPLDSTLLAALLLDFPDQLSAEDETSLRVILTSLLENFESEFDANYSEEGSSSQNQSSSSSYAEKLEVTTRPRSVNTAEVESAFHAWTLEEKEIHADTDGEEEGDINTISRPLSLSGDNVGDSYVKEDRQTSNVSIDSTGAGSEMHTEEQISVQADQLALLYSVFPTMPSNILKARLAEENGDVERTVEALLNESLGTIGSSTSSSGTSTPASSLKNGGNLTKQQRRKAKTAVKASNVLSLTDVLHRAPPANPQNSDTSGMPLRFTSRTRPTNRWAEIDSTATYLASLMHITPGQVSSTWHLCGSSLPLTVSTLLSNLSESRPFGEVQGGEELLMQLETVLPNVKKSQMEILLSASNFEIADALELWEKLADIEREEGSLLRNGLVGFGAESERLTGTRIIRDDHTLSPYTTMESRTKPSNANGTFDGRLARPTLADGSTGGSRDWRLYSSSDCTSLASQYQSRRNEAFKAAARHYQKGSPGDRGAALHYAQQGREMDVRRRTWEERAAKAIVKERRMRATEPDQKNTVDLHGLTLSHALSVVKEACNNWWNQTSQLSPTPLRIVTGVGRHSTNQNPVLMPAVVKLLDRDGWRWKWDGHGAVGSGAVKIFGSLR